MSAKLGVRMLSLVVPLPKVLKDSGKASATSGLSRLGNRRDWSFSGQFSGKPAQL